MAPYRPPLAVQLGLVGEYVSGRELVYPITVASEGGYLRALDFGSHRGVFEGSLAPVLTIGSETFVGRGIDVTLDLGPVRQVVWVRFLPGFSTTLERFGLRNIEGELRRRIVDRMTEIYCPPEDLTACVNVEMRTSEPLDFYSGGYAVLEIGGGDPNNLGLFGYENSPGKDVGNLRLHDHIGGENALGAVDGFGYGGVFVESLLYWSEEEPFAVRPPAAPPPDPRFDQIFGPVRSEPARQGEIESGAPTGRVGQIELAAHELGRGVSQPSPASRMPHGLWL